MFPQVSRWADARIPAVRMPPLIDRIPLSVAAMALLALVALGITASSLAYRGMHRALHRWDANGLAPQPTAEAVDAEWLIEPWLCGPETGHGQACGHLEDLTIGLRADGLLTWRRQNPAPERQRIRDGRVACSKETRRDVDVTVCDGEVVGIEPRGGRRK